LATYGLVTFIFVSIYFILLWVLIPSGAYNKAKELSLERIVSYDKNGCVYNKTSKWSNCVTVTDKEGFQIQGILFAANERYIGIYNKEGNHLIKKSTDLQMTKTKGKIAQPVLQSSV